MIKVARNIIMPHKNFVISKVVPKTTRGSISLALSTLVMCHSIALSGSGAQSQVSRPQGAIAAASPTSSIFNGKLIEGLDRTMAYNRMNGTSPDFPAYAERSGLVTNATVFGKSTVLTREIARIEGMFKSFDLDRMYVMRLDVPLRQYDGERQRYPIGFGESSQIGLSDPMTGHSYALAFRNADDLSFVRVSDGMAVRNFAQRFRFSTQGDSAGAALEVAYRLMDAPPRLGGGADTVRADILAARLLTQNGQLIYNFGPTKAFAQGPARGADSVPGPTVLKAVDTQGFRVGVPFTEADGLGTRGWKVKVGGNEHDGTAQHYNGLAQPAAQPPMAWATCGEIEFGVPDFAACSMGGGRIPAFADCAAVKTKPQPGGANAIVGVSTEQFLAGADLETLPMALRAKYEPPSYVRNNGTNLVWAGRDPVQVENAQVQVTADVQKIGQGTEARVQMTVDIRPYVDPTPKPAA